jgi:hypothetical protein
VICTACSFYPEKGNKSLNCRHFTFPTFVAIAMTIHKSQGGMFERAVYNYHKEQEQQMAMSCVQSLDDLYLTNERNDFNFYHAHGSNSGNTVSWHGCPTTN